ncbi:hypothetical protein [Tropicibacter sp. Alg240-R139]|uniref:hypothetical protein n=1 Tax=Tropicibacter sp. Alg240-R139 TaxID=2305991 RepID=UPI0013DE8F51|nr:hypothetical protein [Tropicibacter sp. Alg240-R139]
MDTGRTKDGKFVIRFPGDSGWTEVSSAEYEAARAGVGERLLMGAGNAVQDAAGGYLATLEKVPLFGTAVTAVEEINNLITGQPFGSRDNRVRDLGLAIARENDPQQDVLQRRNPALNMAAEAIPEIGIGLAARNPTVAIGTDAALGAVQNPENPVAGAIIGAAIGGSTNVVASGAAKGAQRGLDIARQASNAASTRAGIRAVQRQAAEGTIPVPRNVPDDTPTPLRLEPTDRMGSMGAAKNVTPSGELSTRVVGEGMLTSKQLADDYGFPTSAAQKELLDTNDPAKFEAARAQDKEDFDTWRSRGAQMAPLRAAKDFAKPIDDYGALRTMQQRSLNKEVMRAMGEPNAVTATRGNVGEARKAISKSYDEIALRAGDIQAADLVDEIARIVDDNALDDTVARKLQRYGEQILAKIDNQGRITAEQFMGIKNKVAADLRNAYGREPNLELGDALSDVSQAMDARLMNSLDAEDRADLLANRRKWGVANAALRSGAATNARGDVNITSFINSYARGNRRYKIGYDNTRFAQFLDTAAAAMFKESRDSGTPAGLAPMLQGIAEVVGIPGAGLLR